MSMLQIYFYTVVIPNLTTLCVILLLLSSLGIVFTSIYYIEYKAESAGKMAKRCFITSLVLGFLLIFLPSKKDMALIVTGSYASNIEGVKDLPPMAIKALNKYLESTLKDTK